nr:hypothetical protein [Tanacetum cinerariifolium]
MASDTKWKWSCLYHNRYKWHDQEGLHKGYDKFQTLLSQLEIHGAGVSHEDANQKFLRSLPSSWSQVALIMRSKPWLDTLSFDDLYNNLRVFKCDVKGTTASSSSNTQNMAFISADNTSSTNDVSTAYSVSSPSVSKSQKEGSPSYTDKVIHSFFANQSSAPQLDCDDLEHINDNDLEEMDLKWQVAMIFTRIKKFHKRRGRKLQFDTRDTVGFDKTKVECFNYYKIGHFARDCRAKWNQDSRRRDGGYNGYKARDNSRRPTSQDDSKALVTIDGEAVDWSRHTSADESDSKPVEYASSDSDSSVEPSTSTNAPIIKEYESDSDDDLVFNVQEDKEKPSFAFTDYVKHVKSPRENDKEIGIPNHYLKIEKQDRHSHTKKGLGYAFTRKSCFVCGSFIHLIRDYDFHEKRMAKQAALTISKKHVTCQKANRQDDPHIELKDKRIVDSRCSRHMIGNKAHLVDYQEFKGGSVAFGGSNGRITGKGKIKAGMLDFEDVYYVEELKHYNLFSVSQMCDKKNKKGKQHKASCKAKTVSSVNQPLQILHMDLFGPTSNSMNSLEPTPSTIPNQVKVPKELPKVSIENMSLKKLKHHLASFDVVIKERTTAIAITEGTWGFEPIKAYFKDEIIPFVKALKDLLNLFDQFLVDELSEVQNVFHQIEHAIEQHRVESKTFQVKMNNVLNENERLLEQVTGKDVLNIVVNSTVDNAYEPVHECERCLKLENGLQRISLKGKFMINFSNVTPLLKNIVFI